MPPRASSFCPCRCNGPRRLLLKVAEAASAPQRAHVTPRSAPARVEKYQARRAGRSGRKSTEQGCAGPPHRRLPGLPLARGAPGRSRTPGGALCGSRVPGERSARPGRTTPVPVTCQPPPQRPSSMGRPGTVPPPPSTQGRLPPLPVHPSRTGPPLGAPGRAAHPQPPLLQPRQELMQPRPPIVKTRPAVSATENRPTPLAQFCHLEPRCGTWPFPGTHGSRGRVPFPSQGRAWGGNAAPNSRPALATSLVFSALPGGLTRAS